MRDLVGRVGQRFVLGFEGLAASSDIKALIREFGAGHVVLFERNVEGPEQVADLVRELQSTARDAGHARPLLISVDQEGGRFARLREPWTVWPSPRAVGQARSEDLALRMGGAIAAELRACGIRLNFSPVVDVDTRPDNPAIGDRSFGPDPELVGRLGAALVKGLQDGGVAACAKHFPGHGDTSVDSHLGLPSVEHSRERLEEIELPPFRACIDAGVALVMTAHVLVPELDEKRPGTLSPEIVGGLLRGDLGYGGVVSTDDLQMKAVAAHWGPAERAVLAAQAGCDLLEVCSGHDDQVEAMEGLIRAVEAEEVRFKDLEAAQGRVNLLKERFLDGYRDPDPRDARQAAERAEHRAVAEEIAALSGLAV